MRSLSQGSRDVLNNHLSDLLRVVIRGELGEAVDGVPGAVGRVVEDALVVDEAAALPRRAVGHVKVATVG